MQKSAKIFIIRNKSQNRNKRKLVYKSKRMKSTIVRDTAIFEGQGIIKKQKKR